MTEKKISNGLKIHDQIIIIVFAVVFILGGIYFIPKWLTPQASHVFYWCQERKELTRTGGFKGSNQKLAYPRTARIYPAIRNITQIHNIERDLENTTGCSIAAIQAWQNIDCPECKKEAEIEQLEKELIAAGKEIQRLGKGGK